MVEGDINGNEDKEDFNMKCKHPRCINHHKNAIDFCTNACSVGDIDAMILNDEDGTVEVLHDPKKSNQATFNKRGTTVEQIVRQLDLLIESRIERANNRHNYPHAHPFNTVFPVPGTIKHELRELFYKLLAEEIT